MHQTQLPTYKPKDFATDQDVRWTRYDQPCEAHRQRTSSRR